MKLFSIVALALSLTMGLFAEVKLGNEVLAENGFKQLAGKRVGLITNPSGINRQLEQTVDVLRKAPNVKLVALYAPEHGIYGDIFAGDHVDNTTDKRTGLPVFSIYGKTRKPTPEMLKGIDIMVFDLQDIGCRSYTFISSMGLAMEACAENDIEFMVLDRPNPLGGERIEGPMLESEKFRSFVSEWKVPYVYGLTTGELARMINGEKWIKKQCKLTVVPMQGWKRWMTWPDTRLPWVATSPHIPHGDSPLFYPATGIIGELGTVNIGVGYTLPFQCLAVPKADMHALAETLNAYKLPGVKFKPIMYKVFYYTLKDELVSGVQIYLTNPRKAPLTALNCYLYEALKKTAGKDMFTDAEKRFSMFDNVSGTDALRKALQAGTPAKDIVASWQKADDDFRDARKKYLLY